MSLRFSLKSLLVFVANTTTLIAMEGGWNAQGIGQEPSGFEGFNTPKNWVGGRKSPIKSSPSPKVGTARVETETQKLKQKIEEQNGELKRTASEVERLRLELNESREPEPFNPAEHPVYDFRLLQLRYGFKGKEYDGSKVNYEMKLPNQQPQRSALLNTPQTELLTWKESLKKTKKAVRRVIASARDSGHDYTEVLKPFRKKYWVKEGDDLKPLSDEELEKRIFNLWLKTKDLTPKYYTEDPKRVDAANRSMGFMITDPLEVCVGLQMLDRLTTDLMEETAYFQDVLTHYNRDYVPKVKGPTSIAGSWLNWENWWEEETFLKVIEDLKAKYQKQRHWPEGRVFPHPLTEENYVLRIMEKDLLGQSLREKVFPKIKKMNKNAGLIQTSEQTATIKIFKWIENEFLQFHWPLWIGAMEELLSLGDNLRDRLKPVVKQPLQEIYESYKRKLSEYQEALTANVIALKALQQSGFSWGMEPVPYRFVGSREPVYLSLDSKALSLANSNISDEALTLFRSYKSGLSVGVLWKYERVNLAGNLLTFKNPQTFIFGNITDLNVSSNRIESLQFVEDLTVLESLNISGNPVVDLSPLATGSLIIRDLYLSNMGGAGRFLEDLGPLKNLKSLSLLDFSGNKVKGVEPLRGLTTLETVIATNNVIVSLEPLKDMPKLTLLQIGSNPIVTLAPLSNMFALQVLGAESCSYLKGEWDRVLLCANALKKANFTNTPIDWVPTYVDKAKNDAAFQARFPNLELLTVSEGRKLAQVGGNPIQLSDLKEKK